MNTHRSPVLSVVVPAYNEAAGLPHLYDSLTPVIQSLELPYEIIFVNDGSTDDTAGVLADLHKADSAVRVLSLTRNFGKELAVTAGLHRARGQAVLMLDADGQHPVGLIPEFVARWQHGAKVVVGRRTNRHAGFWKRITANLFYGLFRRVTGIAANLETSDFRLIDRAVRQDFCRLTEHRRISRGLIDWLGYPQVYVDYTEAPRHTGRPTYSYRKLFGLAIDSAISLSISPLYITAYIGAVVLPLATLLGLGMLVDWLLRDPLHLRATGSAYLTVVVLWLIGVLLVSQGIIGLYLSHIHTETQNRPLYIVDEANSRGWS